MIQEAVDCVAKVADDGAIEDVARRCGCDLVHAVAHAVVRSVGGRGDEGVSSVVIIAVDDTVALSPIPAGNSRYISKGRAGGGGVSEWVSEWVNG